MLRRSYLLLVCIAAAALASYACGTQQNGGFTAGRDDGGASADGGGPGSTSSGGGGGGGGGASSGASSGGSSGSSSGSLLGDGGIFEGGVGDGSGPPLVCPTPSTNNDFTAPVIDTGAPANAPALFAAADVAGTGPCVYEPESGSLFPNNWVRMRFRFIPANAENLFEIKLVVPNETSPLVIYTTNTSYTLHALAWKAITTVGTNGPIQFSVRSATYANGALTGGPWKGTSGTIEIAPVPAGGTVVYWTTSNGTVLKGFEMGSEAVPQPVLTPPQIGQVCVGCHTSTPDGLFVGLTASPVDNNGDTPAFVDVRSVDGGAMTPAFATMDALTLLARPGQHAPTFSPGHWTPGDRLALSMFTVQGRDEIAWTNLEATSQTQGTGWGIVARNGDANQAASASFSHDGQTIVYTSNTGGNSGTNTDDGLLYTVKFNSGQGGMATALTGASDTGYLQYYPSYSRDDRFIAYNRMSTADGAASTPASYNNPNAEVWIVPATGGMATRVAANDPPACIGAKSPGVMNSWARWSPQVLSVCGNTYYFFVFSSNRDPGAGGGPQLYIAPVVVDSAGKITSYSALYLWTQPESEHNHTPAWDIFQLPPPPPPPPPPQ
jgi:hypothetical protein